ncbi:MAG: hypothetical protein GY858_04370, partial [Candidatus Omnitrophica bacterium]|nr:hypothetical protein [Candidatus Omnitrophota bacterium]
MAFIDPKSAPAGKKELALFSLPPTQVAIVKSYPLYLKKKNPIDSNSPLLFEIPSNPGFLDVSSNTLYVKFKILRQDG